MAWYLRKKMKKYIHEKDTLIDLRLLIYDAHSDLVDVYPTINESNAASVNIAFLHNI